MKAKVLAKLLLKHPEAEVFIEDDEQDFLTAVDGGCLVKKLTDGGEEVFPGIVLHMSEGDTAERVNGQPKGYW